MKENELPKMRMPNDLSEVVANKQTDAGLELHAVRLRTRYTQLGLTVLSRQARWPNGEQ